MDTDSTNSGNDPNNEKVTFDERQQAKVNDLIKEAQGRAAATLRAEANAFKADLDAAKQELDAAKRELSSAKTSTQKKEAGADIAALEAQIAEMKNASQSTIQQLEQLKQQNLAKEQALQEAKNRDRDFRKQITLSKAAEKVNPYNVETVVKLTSECVVWDDNKGNFSVVDPVTGQPRMNSSFEPMSLDEFYSEYASKNQYLIRGSNKAGVGSSESGRFDVANNGKHSVDQIFGKNSNSKLANELALKDPAEYKRLKNIAMDSGLIGDSRRGR